MKMNLFVNKHKVSSSFWKASSSLRREQIVGGKSAVSFRPRWLSAQVMRQCWLAHKFKALNGKNSSQLWKYVLTHLSNGLQCHRQRVLQDDWPDNVDSLVHVARVTRRATYDDKLKFNYKSCNYLSISHNQPIYRHLYRLCISYIGH